MRSCAIRTDSLRSDTMEEVARMCDCKGCQHPEKLEGKPGDCSPEQIRECHGDVDGHPCVEETDDE